jgi:hypothetical protein
MVEDNPSWMRDLLNLMEEAEKAKVLKKKENPDKVIEISDEPLEKIVISSKERGLLWFEMLEILQKLKSKNEIISFPEYFECVCRKFSIKKAKAWNCLFFLVDFGFIEIVKFRGIKLKYTIETK